MLDEVELIDPEREAAQRKRWTYVGLGGLALALVVALWLTLVVITTPPPPAKVVGAERHRHDDVAGRRGAEGQGPATSVR